MRRGGHWLSYVSIRWLNGQKSMPLDIRRRPLYEQIDAVWGAGTAQYSRYIKVGTL